MKNPSRIGWLFVLMLATIAISPGGRAQGPECDFVNPETRDAVLDVQVSLAGVDYRYDYSVRNPSYSTGCIYAAGIETRGGGSSGAPVVIGPGVETFPGGPGLAPGTYSAVLPLHCVAGVGGSGIWWNCPDVIVQPVVDPMHPQVSLGARIARGETLPVFSIVSPFPPGLRKSFLTPDYDVPDEQYDVLRLDTLRVVARTVGPLDLYERQFFSGDGNFGAEGILANELLTYANPDQSPLALRASEVNFPAAIRYGNINPATFHATLNGTDVSCLFHPAGNFIEAPTLVLRAGTNTLVTSVEKFDGGATDIDHLVLEVAAAPVPTPTPAPFAPCGNRPPVCTGAVATPGVLWSPNHKLVPIAISGVSDPERDPVTLLVTSIRQDEPVQNAGAGAGNTSPDATKSPLAVRSERNGDPKNPGDGRVYHIAFSASDGRGGSCTGAVTVCVPHDQSPGTRCTDGGALFDSLTP